MSKWSAATGRIRRHATGILGGRIGGVPAPPNGTGPGVTGPGVTGPSVTAPGVTAPGVTAPGLAGSGGAGLGASAPVRRSGRADGSPTRTSTPTPAPRPRAAAPPNDDTVRMPRQPAAVAVCDADAGTSDDAGVPSALTERTVNLRLPPALRRAAARRPAHRVGRFLRAIDRRLLPPVGRALAALGRGAVWGRVVVATGAVACVALTVIAVYAATRPSTPDPAPAGIHVGVSAGDDIRQYVATRRSALDRAAAAEALGEPVTSRYALVSFASSVPPERLTSLLGGVQAAEVFLRASPAGVLEAPVRLIPADVIKAMSAHALELDRTVADFQTKIRQLGHSPDENALRATYTDTVRADVAEKTAYLSNCACAFGAVVHGSLAALHELARRPGVRVVDLVPLTPDVSRDTFMPLVPDQKLTASPPPIEEVQPP